MPKFDKPTDFKEAMRIARELTVADQRTDFEVYQDIARLVVSCSLGKQLEDLAISPAHKKEVVESEAYAKAQPAHLEDTAIYQPKNLVEMLDGLGVLGFDCKKHCERRLALDKGTELAVKAKTTERNITLRPTFGIFIAMDVHDAEVEATGLPEGTFESHFGGRVVCVISPDCQEACPLPMPSDKSFGQIVDTASDALIQKWQ